MLAARSSTKHRGTGISIDSGVFFKSAKTSSSASASTPSFSATIQCLVSRTRPAHASSAIFTASRFCGWHIWSYTSSRSRKMRRYSACAAANSRRPRGSTGGSGFSIGFAPSAPPEGPGGWRIWFAATTAGSSSSSNGSSLSICTSRSRMDARHCASNVLRVRRAGRTGVERGMKVSARVQIGGCGRRATQFGARRERIESRGGGATRAKTPFAVRGILDALAREYSHVRHVSASRAAGSTRDALASRDRRDSRFGSASLFRCG